MVALRLDDKLQMPHYEFDDERVRYEHRFAPFASLITPPIMHYQEFIEMTTNSKEPQTSVHYYMAGADLFHQARSFLEGLPFLDTEVIISQKRVCIHSITKTLCKYVVDYKKGYFF